MIRRRKLSKLERLARKKVKQIGWHLGRSWWQWGVPWMMNHGHVVGVLKTVSILNTCHNSLTPHCSLYDVGYFIAPLYRCGNCGSEMGSNLPKVM